MKTIDEIQKELGISDEEMARQMVKNGLAATIQDALFQLAISKGEITGDVIEVKSTIKEIVYKHMTGQHNQKRHGWRYSGVSGARSSMRGQDKTERSEYRKRAGMPEPVKKVRVETVKPSGVKVDITKHADDLKGWKADTAKLATNGTIAGYEGTPGFKKGDFFVHKGLDGKTGKWTVSHVSSGLSVQKAGNKKSAMLMASGFARNVPSLKGASGLNEKAKTEFFDFYKEIISKGHSGGFQMYYDSL